MATILGSADDDTVEGSSKSDLIQSGDGADTIRAGAGNDTVYAGAGADQVAGGDGNDTLYGEAGNDSLTGGDGNDNLFGGDGDDVIDGCEDNDKIFGGAGNDRIIASLDNDTIDGGTGSDWYDASALPSAITLNLATGSVRGPGNVTISGVENAIGTRFADTMIGDGNANIIDGNGGNDRLSGGAGDDTLIAGNGNGQYSGDSGNDTLVYTAGSTGSQVFDGGMGADTVRIVLTSGQLTGAVIQELNAYALFEANPLNANATFQFAAIGTLAVADAETLSIIVDGKAVALDDLLNSAPEIDSASDTSLSVLQNKAFEGSVLAHYANGDRLSFAVADGPDHGTISLDAATGKYVYTAGDFVGADSFVVRVADGKGGFADHTVAVALTNQAPEFLAQSASQIEVGHGKSVAGTAAAADADGDSYKFSITSGPEHGTLIFTDESGSYVYTADNYVGWDSFTMRVQDEHGGYSEHTVRVNSTNTGPVIDTAASTAAITAVYDTSVSGQVVATDFDGDGVSFTLKSGPANGSVDVDASGRFTFHAVDAAGVDRFVVTASDGHGGSADHMVNVGVIGTLDGSAAASAVNVNLTTGAATGVEQSKLAWAINVIGSAFSDFINGDGRANVLSGGAGRDELRGLAGHDRIDGGIGDDRLFGDDGNDTLAGGDGNDALNGGAHDDTLRGGVGNDGVFGGGGNDRIQGGEGSDRIYGDGGDDVISGGAGNDIMTGAGFNNGGAKGANTYAWERADVVNPNGTSAGLDRITDFGVGDRVDFTGLVSAPVSAAHDVVRVTDTAAGLVLSVDMGGTAGFVDVVVLDNVHGLSVDDLDHSGAIHI